MSSAIIVCTHGHASEEIIKTAEMIMGEQENVGFVNFVPGENTDDLVGKFQKSLDELDRSKGVLVMVDLFGGSPFNAISQLALADENIEVITGVNIPMVLETLALRASQDIKSLAETAKNAGINGVTVLEKNIEESNDDVEDEL
jgi:mannose/fructose/sorbose-specific phosphotransferase system IIA component